MMMFTCTYEFDCLEIEISGIRVGSFTGAADLSEDGSDFFVERIWLDGEKVERRPGQIIPARTRHKVRLPKPPYDGGGTFEQRLYRHIEEAIYADRSASEFFAEEIAMEYAA